jgi:hypothetical protein
MDEEAAKSVLILIVCLILVIIGIAVAPQYFADLKKGLDSLKPAPVMINVIFKDRIDKTNLPLEALPDNPDISAPVQLVSYDTSWLKVMLPDGRDLWINRDLIVSWANVPAATAMPTAAATSQAAQ